MMIAAVAFDNAGNPSPVYRERFICTRDGAGDAQEFVDYYLGEITRSAVDRGYLDIESAPVKQQALAKKLHNARGVTFEKIR
jgi:hypothetical protein